MSSTRSSAKFGVERVSTFDVMLNNVKYLRENETFGVLPLR